MNLTILVSLAQNIAVLLALAFLYSMMRPWLLRFSTRQRSVIQGVIFGLFGVLAILTGLQVAPGFVLDSRTVILSIAGFTGGPVTGLIAAVIVALFRIVFIGTTASSTPIITIFISVGVGVGLGWYLRRRNIQVTPLWFLVLGMLTTAVRVSVSLLLATPEGMTLLMQTIIPTSILFPLGTWLLGTLILNQERHQETVDALAAERRMMRTLIDNVPDYIFIKDRDGRFILSNVAHSRAARVQTDQTLLGKQASNFFPSEFVAQYAEDDRHVLQGESILSQERRTVNADGEVIWVTSTKVPMRSERGEITGILGVSRDITERKKADEALRQSEFKYRRIMEAASEGIWMLNPDEVVTFINPHMAATLGYSVEEMIGQPVSKFTYPDDIEMTNGKSERRRQGVTEEYDLRLLTRDGRVLSTIVSAAPMTDEQGNFLGSLSMTTDITDRRNAAQRELELVAERQRVQVLKRFIGDMSHDFRTPLSILQTGLFILRKSASETQMQRIDRLEEQVKRLAKLFDEMLDVYTLEHEEQVLLNAHDVNEVIGSAVEKHQALAESKAETLRFEPGDNLPPIMLDRWLIDRALSHLIGNALTYTPDNGTITVRTGVQGQQVVIAIEDTGAGIPAEALPHIFEHFYRGDQARSTATGGNGLGLAIARKIVEAHRGTISVVSEPGKGSTFTIAFPIPEAAPAVMP